MSFALKTFVTPLLRVLGDSNIRGNRNFHRWLAPTLRSLKRRKDEMDPEPPSRRSDFIEWNYNAEIYAFGKRLGEDFNQEVLKQALIEQSYIDQEAEKRRHVNLEPEMDIENNLSLAAEGEVLLKDCVSKYLALTLPHLPKKYILSIEEFLLSTDNLANVSSNIGIDDLVLCAEFPLDNNMLARNLKSVTHALVLSSGKDRACVFIKDFVIAQLVGKDLSTFCMPENPLLELADTLQRQNREPPEPRLISASGKNTILATYEVGIYCNKAMIGRGIGESAEVAQEMAACDALWRIWGVTRSKRPFPFKIDFPSEIPLLKTQKADAIS